MNSSRVSSQSTRCSGKISISVLFILFAFFVTLNIDLIECKKPKAKVGGGSSSSNNKCDERKFDDCAASVLVFGKRDVYLPKNPEEMVPHCQEEFDAEKCVKQYARKCMAPLPRQLVSVLIHGASQVIHSRCKPRGVKEYLSHKQCLGETIDELHDCMDQLIVSLQIIEKRPKVTERVPLACCAFARYEHCSAQPTKRKCKNDPTASDYISIKMIKGYASEVLDIACPGYDWKGDKCQSMSVPDGGLEYRGDDDETAPNGRIVFTQAANKTLKSKTASLIPPFINIFTKL